MAQKLIRDIPDPVMQIIEEKAAASSQKNSEAYIRELLVQHASQPVIRARYAYRFYNDNDSARGLVRRFGDEPNATICTFSSVTSEVADICGKVEDLMRRNNLGDREKAISLLQQQFNNVFEVPV